MFLDGKPMQHDTMMFRRGRRRPVTHPGCGNGIASQHNDGILAGASETCETATARCLTMPDLPTTEYGPRFSTQAWSMRSLRGEYANSATRLRLLSASASPKGWGRQAGIPTSLNPRTQRLSPESTSAYHCNTSCRVAVTQPNPTPVFFSSVADGPRNIKRTPR